jgi:hypothetical protein
MPADPRRAMRAVFRYGKPRACPEDGLLFIPEARQEFLSLQDVQPYGTATACRLDDYPRGWSLCRSQIHSQIQALSSTFERLYKVLIL